MNAFYNITGFHHGVGADMSRRVGARDALNYGTLGYCRGKSVSRQNAVSWDLFWDDGLV
jgi:hypothetical protein